MARLGLASTLTLCALALGAGACSSGDDDDTTTTVRDGGSRDGGAARDAGPRDGGFVEPDVCDDLGLPRVAFQEGSSTYAFGDLAGDFRVTTFAGDWILSQEWTGCESYVFLNYIPDNNTTFEDDLFNSSPAYFVETPVNTHWFFLVTIAQENARIMKLQDIKGRVDSAIDAATDDEDERAAQRRRFHYVLDAPVQIAGSVSAFIMDYNTYRTNPANYADLGDRGRAPPPPAYAFAIDRDQRWDPVGNLNQTVGSPPAFQMASYVAGFFDHKAAIRDRVAAESGVETFVLLEETVTEREFIREATLPSAATMATFDTLELDVSVTCRERNVFACSEWDRIAHIFVCLDDMCTDRRELVRWITPYWRRGQRRWIMDASSLMGLIADGGSQRFQIVMGPTWERATPRDVRIALRLSNQDRGTRGTGAELAFTGGDFNDTYNTRDPYRFTPPATATRVELVVILSGHGQEAGNNCAEWCDHRHNFSVGGTALPEIAHVGNIGSRDGCGPLASRGVPPGQYGNWAPERAYWCPGLPVDPIRIDITNEVTLGAENELTYRGAFRTGAPSGGNISLSAFVAWYE